MTDMPSKTPNFKVDRKLPLRDQIYSMLRTHILTGRIGPGEAIDEKAIAAHLTVSRTPVREALKRLSDEHLVVIVAQSGTHATSIDRKEIEQAFLIRRALEVESAAQATARMTQEHADHLNDILHLHERAVERRYYSLAIGHDDSFHRYLTAMSDLPLLWRSIEISKAQLDRCRHMMLPRAGEAEATLEQHRAIIRALNTGNPQTARDAMAKHLEAAFGNTIRAMDAGEMGAVVTNLQKTA
jgi:GntR family transcriptional regulator, rspAB operon transcriptional repressor